MLQDRLPKIPARGHYTEESRQKRLSFIRTETNTDLSHIADLSIDPKKLIGNIESLIGSVEIPIGVAGPLLMKGQYVQGLSYAPIATTEGALVSSAIRGAKAISLAGGVKTRILAQRMLRVPLFVLENLEQAVLFSEWLLENDRSIKEQVNQYSNYANLKEVYPQIMGKQVHVHFVYETGDAAGQNMTTTCTWHICQWIIKQLSAFKDSMRIDSFLIEANLSSDKKAGYASFLQGRGIRVTGETVIPDRVMQRVLKVTPKQLVDAYHRFTSGSIAAGMVGMNINFSNIIASIFTATGQDIACVHESSIGQLYLELTEQNEVYASAILPSLIVGTVGGGTALPHQRECLEIMGCTNTSNNVFKLAEIIAGFCLSLDLSTLSAIASDRFARSHEKLGRNHPVRWLKPADFDNTFFASALQNYYQSKSVEVQRIEPLKNAQLGSSILTELASHKFNKKLIGHFPYQVHYANGSGKQRQQEMLLKVKPLDDEVILMLNAMAAQCHPGLAKAYNTFKEHTGFKKCHVRELAVMSQNDPRFMRYSPIVFDAYQDPDREAYVLVQEYLSNMILMDSVNDVSLWTMEYILKAIEGISSIHSIWYQREEELKQQDWLGYYPTQKNMVEKQDLWEMLAVHATEEFDWLNTWDLDYHLKVISQIDEWFTCVDRMPKTLIHNDFNPRNIAFRKTSNEPVLCCYDWELATLHLPQHDLAELLIFTLTDKANVDEVERYIEHHRTELSRACGVNIDRESWFFGYKLCLWDLMINRVPMYLMAHTFRHYNFIERVVTTLRHLVSISEKLT